MILIDPREQHKEYITKYFDSIGGVPSVITVLSQGVDYLIVNDHGSVGIQRKSSDDLFQHMDKLRTIDIPNLRDATDNPVLLIEEQFHVDRNGHMYRRQNGFLYEVGIIASSYYNFINSIKLMGCEVVCTRNLEQSIWWMVSTHSYLKLEHFPKQKKGHEHIMQAIGALCCVNNIGQTSATKLLKKHTLQELMCMSDTELQKILNSNQFYNFTHVRSVKYG